MLKLEHLRQPFLLSCEMHFLNSCTKFCTKPIFRVFSFIFECLKKQKIRTPKSAENPCKIKKNRKIYHLPIPGLSDWT